MTDHAKSSSEQSIFVLSLKLIGRVACLVAFALAAVQIWNSDYSHATMLLVIGFGGSLGLDCDDILRRLDELEGRRP